MFSFPPEFPFVSGRKAEAKPRPAPPEPQIAPTEAPVIGEPAAPDAPAPRQAAAMPTVVKSLPVVAEVRKSAPLPAAAPARPERRKVKRDALATSALLRVDGFHGPPSKIELIDISIAGARFRCPHPLEIGEKAQVRLEVGPFRWTTRLRIIHCTRIDQHSVSIGCAFLRTELLRPWPAAA